MWLKRWRERLTLEEKPLANIASLMRNVNPQYIPRNHLIEQAIKAAVDNSDFSLMQNLISVLKDPYKEQEGMQQYAKPPEACERVYQTFCGT